MNKRQASHQHNFNDEGIHIIYCSNNIDGTICEYAKDKKTSKIGKFDIINHQGRLDYSICHDKNNSIGCCHKKDEKCVCDCHYEEKRELEILGTLIFANPCIGCLNLHKPITKLTLIEYQKLCLTHRETYDKEQEILKNTKKEKGSEQK